MELKNARESGDVVVRFNRARGESFRQWDPVLADKFAAIATAYGELFEYIKSRGE